MSRADRVEAMFLEDIPPERHEQARKDIQNTLAWQHARFVDLLAELGRAILNALTPGRLRR